MKEIVHIIPDEKFTYGYIDFMNICIPEFNHIFIITESSVQSNNINKNNIIMIKDYKDLILNKNIKELLNEAYKIIISGFFKINKAALFFKKSIWEKTYIQFWGGDFYIFNSEKMNWRVKISKRNKAACIKRCSGIINLVQGEFKELCKIFPNNKPHFVAPIMSSPIKRIDYSTYKKEKSDNKFRILLGNSATASNNHIEIIKKISESSRDDIIVVCPLSYGESEYRDQVIEKGRKLLGEKFVPITDFMERTDYVQMLANCDCGIFNNDRQQAMGNINIMLGLGKSVYIRNNTSMWNKYINEGYLIHSIDQLDFNTINFCPEDEINAKIFKNGLEDRMKKAADNWREIFTYGENNGK